MFASFASNLRAAFSAGSSSSVNQKHTSSPSSASAPSSKKYTAKDLAAVLWEINLTDQKITELVTGYLFTGWELYLQEPSHRFVELTNLKVLKNYIMPDLEDEDVDVAKTTVEQIYERNSPLSTRNYGFAFPMEPEALSYAMQNLVKGKTALEIAAGNGLNSVLLAYAGAKKVYVNDLLEKEMSRLKLAISKAFDAVQNNLEIIQTDCFTLLQKKPKLSHAIDFILCRNLVHFFTTSGQKQFFQLLKNLLKPGGGAMLTVNCAYAHPALSILKENPHETFFVMNQCILYENSYGIKKINDILYQELIPVTKEPLGLSIVDNFTDFPLRLMPNNTNGWEVDFPCPTSPQLQDKIRKKIQSDSQKIGSIIFTGGEVRVNSCFIQIFNKRNLTSLVEKHGFAVENVYLVGSSGHYIADEEVAKKHVQQMGIIFHKPLE